MYYRVSNATVSVANVESAHHSTRLLAQTTLRNILGTKNLHEILSDRDSISGSMQVKMYTWLVNAVKVQSFLYAHIFCHTIKPLILYSLQNVLDEATSAWGIKVERVEM